MGTGAIETSIEREAEVPRPPAPEVDGHHLVVRLLKLALLALPLVALYYAPEASVPWVWAPLLARAWIGLLLGLAFFNAERLGFRRPAVTYTLVPLVMLVAAPMLAWRLVSLPDRYWHGTVYPRQWTWWHRLGALLGAVVAVGALVEGVSEHRTRAGRADGFVQRDGRDLSGGLEPELGRFSGFYGGGGFEAAVSDGDEIWVHGTYPDEAVVAVGSGQSVRTPSPVQALAFAGGRVWAAGGGKAEGSDGDVGWVARINPRTTEIEGFLTMEGAIPTAAATTGDVVWIAASNGTVWRLDADRSRWLTKTVLPEPRGEDRPGAASLAVASDGVWVGHDRLYRLDTETGDIRRRLDVDCCVAGLAGGVDGVLVMAQVLGNDDLEGMQRFAVVDTRTNDIRPIPLVANSPLVVPAVVGARMYTQEDDGTTIATRTLDGHAVGQPIVLARPATLLAALERGGRVVAVLEQDGPTLSVLDLGPVVRTGPLD